MRLHTSVLPVDGEEIFHRDIETFGATEEREYYRLRLKLQFFAEEGPGGEKTEEATPKKLEDARKEGQVARSQELTTAVALIMVFAIIKVFVSFITDGFSDSFKLMYGSIETYSKEVFNSAYATAYMQEALTEVLIICLPMFTAAVAAAIIVNALQVKWKPTAKPLKPKASKISPLKGFKKIFSKDKIFDLIKAIVKIALVGYMTYSTLKDEADTINILYDIDLLPAIMLIGDIVLNMGIKISLVFLVIGVVDYIYQKMKFSREMRMTKQEIKDEFKQTEGDPKIKGQIRQKMRDASRRRMMQKLPEADVVITNPTHLACAIKYDRDIGTAPVLIAKGADFLAQRIKEVARENFIPIVENKPLARMLYHNVELDEEIPEELYKMTAEVLAYVYAMEGREA
ncbi:MAG: flagellar biosynthesis protein FlhB [Lachnospiraceae bacterium]|nr:flagellar biosynthesis protein FlhB [Lachnospiraceae bacterium]